MGMGIAAGHGAGHCVTQWTMHVNHWGSPNVVGIEISLSLSEGPERMQAYEVDMKDVGKRGLGWLLEKTWSSVWKRE